MYETGGRQYLLVPAASAPAGRGRGAGPTTTPTESAAGNPGPMGWWCTRYRSGSRSPLAVA